MTRNASIIAVTSGKGGVGKTHISANLGVLLAKQGRRTCVIDADHGLANINLILGIAANQYPKNLFDANFDPLDAIVKTDMGVDILPSASGISQSNHLNAPNKAQIEQLLNKLKPHYDVILVDTAAGIGGSVENYLAAADHALLIINSEPTSLTDAFGLVRKMKPIQPFYNVIINRVTNAAAATSIYKRFAGAVRKYIGAQVGAIGYISEDSFVSAAVLTQTAVVKYSPSCLASQCLRRIARTLTRKLMEESGLTNDIQNSETNANTESIDQRLRETLNQLVQEEQELEQETQQKIESEASTRETKDNPTEAIEKLTIEPIPASPSFIRTEMPADPFEDLLVQLKQYFDANSVTEKTRASRRRKLVQELEKMCDHDGALLADIEELVMKHSDKNSESIIEQTNIANRLAKTRFVEEPTIENSARRGFGGNGVSRAFSIISKLK